jgi:flavin-dependent dehydrogenase
MAKKEYDIIVVGAGFGGPVVAKECADAGFSTLMLERAATPGQKVISSCTIPFYGFLFGPEWIRNGNPPIERPVSGIRNNFIRNGKTYKIDNSFRIPGPIWPHLAIGYTVYCRPFCTWLADRAVESGVELRTSVTAVDVIKEGKAVRGVITDKGEELRCKLLIDAEGVQNLLATKAGIREPFRPEIIELCLIYDLEMKKEHIDRVCGYNIEYFWSMPDEGMVAPLGQGSAVYIFPYRDSIHMTIGQFLKSDDGKVPTEKVLEQYYQKFFQTECWKKLYAPHAKLRARVWDTCPIYAGLYEDQRNLPTFGDGILLIGDSAGLEAAAIADGVPSAWFSAEIAAQCAIEALKAGDTSAAFLSRYDRRLRKHPLINALITDPHRKDLAKAAKSGSEADMRRRVNRGWGIRLIGRLFFPVTRAVLKEMFKNPLVLKSWLNMFKRYFKLYG